jgi:hypothetical protein
MTANIAEAPEKRENDALVDHHREALDGKQRRHAISANFARRRFASTWRPFTPSTAACAAASVEKRELAALEIDHDFGRGDRAVLRADGAEGAEFRLREVSSAGIDK